jgi:RNA polymerase sigma-70 factor (ECF subfamily)
LCIRRDKGLAEDAVQDAWIAAFHSISGFDGGFSIFSWLARIVINKAICPAAARGARWRSRHSSRDRPSARRTWSVSRRGSTHSTRSGLLLEQEVFRRFDGALRALPAGQRSVLLLRDLGGASSAEACRVLQINDLTQRVRLCRARSTVRQAVRADRRLAT